MQRLSQIGGEVTRRLRRPGKTGGYAAFASHVSESVKKSKIPKLDGTQLSRAVSHRNTCAGYSNRTSTSDYCTPIPTLTNPSGNAQTADLYLAGYNREVVRHFCANRPCQASACLNVPGFSTSSCLTLSVGHKYPRSAMVESGGEIAPTGRKCSSALPPLDLFCSNAC